jgi:hypothetical protein
MASHAFGLACIARRISRAPDAAGRHRPPANAKDNPKRRCRVWCLWESLMRELISLQ